MWRYRQATFGVITPLNSAGSVVSRCDIYGYIIVLGVFIAFQYLVKACHWNEVHLSVS